MNPFILTNIENINKNYDEIIIRKSDIITIMISLKEKHYMFTVKNNDTKTYVNAMFRVAVDYING